MQFLDRLRGASGEKLVLCDECAIDIGNHEANSGSLRIELRCAIAHELGHLLLGPSSHSAGGIMRGEWGPKELQLALMGGLLFASQQAKVIREEARRRMSLQTGTAKERRLATVDSRAEPKGIPQSD